MLDNGPEEDIIAVLHVQHDVMHVLQLIQFEVVQLQVVSGHECSPWLGNRIVNGRGMSLVEVLIAFVRIESKGTHLVCGDPAELVLVADLVESFESVFEGLAIDDDVII